MSLSILDQIQARAIIPNVYRDCRVEMKENGMRTLSTKAMAMFKQTFMCNTACLDGGGDVEGGQEERVQGHGQKTALQLEIANCQHRTGIHVDTARLQTRVGRHQPIDQLPQFYAPLC